MTKLEEIENAIRALSAEEIAKLRAFLDELDGQLFDAKIERDAKSGKLDKLAASALAGHRAGKSREL